MAKGRVCKTLIRRFDSDPHLDLFVIFLFAFLIRLLHYFLVRDNFWFRIPVADDRVYDMWAREILAGNWLLRSKGPFRFNPGYPYFLAGVYGLFGTAIDSVVILQHQMGALCCALTAWIGRRVFTPAVGRTAGFLLALYGPCLLFESRLLAAIPIIFANLLLLCFLLKGLTQPEKRWWLFAGLACGISWLFNPSIALFAAGLWVWLLIESKARGKFWTQAGIFFAGTLLIIGPCVVRNTALNEGKGLLGTTTAAGFGFYQGNNEKANGTATVPPGVEFSPYMNEGFHDEAEQRLNKTLTPSEASRYWFREALVWIGTHPGSYVRLLGNKALYLIDDFDIHDNFPPDQVGTYQNLGWVPLLGWGLMLSLGLTGAIWTWKSTRKRTVLLYLYLAATLAVVFIYFVLARYRFPAVPALALFASLALVEFARRWRAGERSRLWVPGACLLVLFALSKSLATRHVDYWQNHLANARTKIGQGKPEGAISEYETAHQMNPNDPAILKELAAAQFTAKQYQPALNNLAALEKRTGSNDPWITASRGQIYSQMGNYPEAARAFEKLTQLQPKDPEAFLALGLCRWKMGEKEGARSAVSRAVSLSPENADLKRTLKEMTSQIRP